jgi:hypothetical protein
MSNDNKITDLPLTERDGMLAALEQLKRNAIFLCDYGKQLARIRRSHYDAYIAEGFTPEQSLILCQKAVL